MTLRRLHDLGHRELFGHDFALVNPLRVPGDRWSDLPVLPLRAPAFDAQPHLLPRLLPLGGLACDMQVELLERNDRHGLETGQPMFCALLAGRVEAGALSAALGRRMLVEVPGGGQAWLRFHDPRVFSALAWWLDDAQLACLLGPARAWTWFDPRDGRWHRLERPAAVEASAARLRLADGQWERLERLPRVNRGLRALAGGGTVIAPLRPVVERIDRHLAAGGGETDHDLREWFRADHGHMEELA